MATRRSPSRESSVSRQSLAERPSISRLSNPDVFSDDFAVSSRGNSPVDSMDGSVDSLPTHASSQPPPPQPSTIVSPSHLNTINFSRPSSTAKRHFISGNGLSVASHRVVSSVSQYDASPQRSSSVSSHFSIPRAQSPYTGPTAPSQPYAMYPQVTRTSSIASESTIRPVERPFVGTGGPEHPYGMYPQNTVDEEDDDDDETHNLPSTIPLGFPGMGQVYRGNQSHGHDLGDIVGHDGHVEQLPPYTRYADNTIAKSSSDDIPAPVAAADISPSAASASSPTSGSNVNSNSTVDRENEQIDTEHNEKSRTPRRLRRKVCWGVSLCVWLLVVAVVVIAGTLGGVIGGVIGNDRASDHSSTPTATTTVWLDAAPLPTGVPPPNCTPGLYAMPTTNNSLHTNSCISNQQYGAAWQCVDQESVPFFIEYQSSHPYINIGPVYPPWQSPGFSYGAQVPFFNGSFYPLTPQIDKDDPNAGGAMFFHALYNKLTVVPSKLLHGSSKRSLDFEYLQSRSSIPYPVSKTDYPYFCWFNQTLLELFIYSNRSTKADASNSTAFAYTTSTTASPTSSSDTASTTMASQSSTLYMNQVSYPTTAPPPPIPYSDTSDGAWPTSNFWPPSERFARRDADDFKIYPKQLRLAEKRAPSGIDIKPYCVQMGIREEDWSVFPIRGTEIQIEEVEPVMSGVSRRSNRPRQPTSSNNLDSDCACQWYST